MADPAPLTDDELAEVAADMYPLSAIRLVATVEQLRRERDAARDVIRRLLDLGMTEEATDG